MSLLTLKKYQHHLHEKEDMNLINSKSKSILALNTITGASTSTVQLQMAFSNGVATSSEISAVCLAFAGLPHI